MTKAINISTTAHRFKTAMIVKEDFANNHYLFVGDYLTHTNTELLELSSAPGDILVDAYKNMIFGKKIIDTDLSFLIRNVPWQDNTIYEMYDDRDQNLEDQDFFVNTNEGSFSHIWKCLDNNNRANSTEQPSFTAGANAALYQTSDGYRWKYMTSLSASTVLKFSTTDYFPIVANTNVSAAAIPGSIDIIKVENQGKRYNNWLDGQFRNQDLRFNGDPTLFALSNTTTINFTNGYYTGCVLYLSVGTGSGQYKRIIDYISNTSANIIKIDGEFATAPTNGTQFEIRPEVIVTPVDNVPTTNCVARGLVNTFNSNSIYRVEILDPGANYSDAIANVIANVVVGVSNTADLRPINSPFGGHGYWQYQELFCKDFGVSVALANTISNTVPINNFYQQIGILQSPLFANVNIALTNNYGSFTTGETIYSFTPHQLNINATCTILSSNVSCNTANWLSQVSPNDYIYFSAAANTVAQLVQVNSVINATHITLKSVALFSCTDLTICSANLGESAIVTKINTSNNIVVTNCSSGFGTSMRIIGSNTGATGIISQFSRNGETKGFNTFVELYKYNSDIITGSFSQNEKIIQNDIEGHVFSISSSNSGTAYLSNFSKSVISNGQIIGDTSHAIANLTQSYPRELVYGTGEVVYIENIEEVQRLPNQTETIQVVFNF